MVALKGGEIERFVRAPRKDCLLILVYGPDAGLVGERARLIATTLLDGSDDPFARADLDPAAIAADPGRLVDEAGMLPPFGGRRVVHVRRGDGALAPAATALLDSAVDGASVVIEQGDLRRDAPLRKLAEKHKNAVALPCYADTDASIGTLIDDQLAAFGLLIDRDAKSALTDLLGGDRLASRNELEKLCLYASGKERVELSDIEAICGDAASLELDGFIDAVGLGDVAEADRQLGRLLQSGQAPQALISALNRHFDLLRLLRRAIDQGQTAEAALKSVRPPIFFRREKAVRQQVLRWPLAALERARDTLGRTDLDSRRQGDLGETLLARTVLSLAAEGRRLARGNA